MMIKNRRKNLKRNKGKPIGNFFSSFCTLQNLLIILLVLSFYKPIFAQEVVIVTEEYPPFNYFDSATGKAAGVSTEIVLALLKEVCLKADF